MRRFLFTLAGLSLMFAPVQAQDIEIGGLLDVGYLHNFNDPAKGSGTGGISNGVGIHNDDSFQVNLAQLSVSKEADPVGFNLTLDFFQTAANDQLGDLDGATADEDDIALQAANVVWNTDYGNGLSVTAGKMETLVGFDVIESASNPHMTHGLLFALVPLTHTGVRFGYPIMDNANLTLGFNNGADRDVDNNHGKSLEAQLAVSPSESWFASLTFNFGAETAVESNKTLLINFVTTYDFTEELSAYAEFTYADKEGQSAATAGNDTSGYGFGLGATYWATDVYGVSARWEYVDNDGADNAFLGATVESVWDITLTGHVKLTDDLTFRVEFRHDNADMVGAAVGTVGDEGAALEDSVNTLGVQLLYSF
jgi:hypothetical protein